MSKKQRKSNIFKRIYNDFWFRVIFLLSLFSISKPPIVRENFEYQDDGSFGPKFLVDTFRIEMAFFVSKEIMKIFDRDHDNHSIDTIRAQLQVAVEALEEIGNTQTLGDRPGYPESAAWCREVRRLSQAAITKIKEMGR